MILSDFNEFVKEKNNIGLKRVAVGAIGLLNNEPGSHFRGGADARGPEVALCLTYFVNKNIRIFKNAFLLSKSRQIVGKFIPVQFGHFCPGFGVETTSTNI